MFRLHFYPVAESYVLVVLAAVVLFGLLAVGPGRNRVSPGRRFVLGLIRLLVILLAVAAMLRPTLVYTESKTQPATLLILADQSRSMSVPDSLGGKSRWESLRRSLGEAAGELDRLAKEFEVKLYAFDAEPHEIKLQRGAAQLPDTPDGAETAIGAVMEDVLRREAGRRLLGVILLSDGAQRAYAPRDTAPQVAATRLKNLGYRLYTFPFGQARQGKDIGVQDLICNEQVFVKNQLEVTGQVRFEGFANRDVSVQLKVELTPGQNEVVDQVMLHASDEDQLVPFKFHYTPQTAGEIRVSVEAVPQPGERVITNNQLSTFVNVLKGGINVLYCEGGLRVEQKFLRRGLDGSPDIKVDFLRLDPRRPQGRPADLGERFKSGRYDVYILGDVDASAFAAAQLEDLAQAVRQGAGLIMLGGYQSFGAGGYAGTALRNVLPVEMTPLERQDPGKPVRGDLHVPGPLAMRPSDQALGHFALSLSSQPGQNLPTWEKLPPLEGANRFGNLAPAAVMLAQAGKTPLLVAQSFGNGRVMAFAGDTTWRWWMRGYEKEFKRFWRQIILWLARKDQAVEGNVWVKFQQRRLTPNQRAEFTVGAQSPTGEALDDLIGEAVVTLPDGSRQPASLTGQGGQLAGVFRETAAPGDYSVEVTVRHKDQALGAARGRFLVSQQDLELDNASADLPLMTNLAAMTGGERMAPEQLSELIRKLAQNVEHLLVQQETKKTFWDTWPFFLAFVGLLGVEWYLRKRWGLV